MMNISTIVNSVKCTFFACFVHFLHVLEGSTANVEHTGALRLVPKHKRSQNVEKNNMPI